MNDPTLQPIPSRSPLHHQSQLASIRILVVDDQEMVQQMLLMLLQSQPDFQVVGQARSGEQALILVETLQPDVVLVDVEMSGMDGLTTTRMIQQHFRTKVLMLSSHDHEDYIRQSLQAGAQGYLLKNTPAEELAHAIRFVQRGYIQLGPGLFEKLEVMSTLDMERRPADSEIHQSTIVMTGEPLAVVPTTEPLRSALAEADEQEWSAATRELIDTLPHVWSRGLLYLSLAVATTLVAWGVFFRMDEVGTARGRLEPKGSTIRLDAPVSGKVARVLVSEGQTVQVGQPLLELEAEPIRSELQQIRARLEGQLSRLTQLQGIRNQLQIAITAQQQQNQAQAAEKLAQLSSAQQSLSTSQVNAPLQASEVLAQLRQAEQDLDDAKRLYQLVDSRWKRDVAEVRRFARLRREGIVPEVQVVQVERTADESLRQREQGRAAVMKAQNRLNEQRSIYAKLVHQIRSDLKQAENRLQEQQAGQRSLRHTGELALIRSQQQFKETESQISDLQAEILQSQAQQKSVEFQLSQRVIRASATGTIFHLPIRHPGTMLEPGQLVTQLAPEQTPLVLKAQISSQDSGFLRVGLPVKVKFDAYPFQDYGVVQGRVVWLAPDSRPVASQQPVIPQSDTAANGTFELDIELNQTHIQTSNRRIVLKPGQMATAEVVIRERRMIDFVLDPFRKLGGSQDP
jgi:hemolysin D